MEPFEAPSTVFTTERVRYQAQSLLGWGGMGAFTAKNAKAVAE